jgi:hypothetical protein
MKTQNKESQSGNSTKSTSSSDKIKTDMPISEKDEVKSAERRMRKKALKDHL